MLVGTLVFIHFLICAALIALVLMHSGREAGMGGLGFVPASQGGTHIVERNLTNRRRYTGPRALVAELVDAQG
jgi:protein translocase SecG subunit